MPGDSRTRVAGLDSIRFVAALWVAISHLGQPTIAVDRSNLALWAATSFYNSLFSGPAAVIVFFVVSGFCIHYPYATGNRLDVPSFYVRRYLRISIPMLAAMVIAVPMGVPLALFEHSILWSLVAELIYYTLYPAILPTWRRFGGTGWLVFSYCVSIVVISTDPGARDYPSYGWKLTWLLGLPCWLLGVALADRWARRAVPEVGAGDIWKWRFIIFGLSVVCHVLRFHSPVGYPWSLGLFAVAVYLWLLRELAWGVRHLPWRFLEWAGSFSYSTYLVHLLVIAAIARIGWPATNSGPDWLIKIGLILVSSYVFYLLFERTSHSMARQLAHGLRRRASNGADKPIPAAPD